MKTIKIINRLGIGSKIKIKYLYLKKPETETETGIVYVMRNTSSTKSTILRLSNNLNMDKTLTIPGMNRTIAKCKVIPYKYYKFRYKR